MIAVDTNILVYCHREDMPHHEKAFEALAGLAESERSWGIPWPCIGEFLAVVTNKRIFQKPSPMSLAIEQIDAWMEAPRCTLLSESKRDLYWKELKSILVVSKIRGRLVHDARVATLCLIHNATLWTADRDFSRFPLRTVNPLL